MLEPLNMDNSKKSDFKFNGHKVTHSEITIKGVVSSDIDLSINLSARGEKNKSDFILYIDSEISDKENTFNVKLTTEGYFSFKEDLSINEISPYFTFNAPAILFPYIRAYISTLTSLSGIGEILLPTLNLTGLGQGLANNITEKSE